MKKYTGVGFRIDPERSEGFSPKSASHWIRIAEAPEPSSVFRTGDPAWLADQAVCTAAVCGLLDSGEQDDGVLL